MFDFEKRQEIYKVDLGTGQYKQISPFTEY